MLEKCIYKGVTPLDNIICNKCNQFLNICNPIITTDDGYSASSECDSYLCDGCCRTDCIYKTLINQ